ncbi:MAG: Nramp family divalent metal transporter [Planctomycetes bacterium]|nr:Nramp family divalent metal transporter [Planctomycetota bacterium]
MAGEVSPNNDAPPTESAPAVHIPVTQLPPWDVAELPEPQPLRWRNWKRFIGPGLLMMGANIGGGEWLLGPEVAARYGGGLFWLATIAILGQVFYNLETGRYALYCGEPTFTGFMRTWPGPRFWVGIYLILTLSAFLPGLAFNAATICAALFLDRPPTADDAPLVLLFGFACFAMVVLPVIFGGKVYNALLAVMTVKVLIVLGFTLVMGLLFVKPEHWMEVFGGFLRFGTVPSPDAPEGQAVVNAFAFYHENGRWPHLDLEHVSVLAAFAAVAGGGGLGNSLYSNFVRDKGWGMGSLVGAIPSAIGGTTIQLSHLGKVFPITAENLRRWKTWWRYILTDQAFVWLPGCFIGMALPSLLSIEFAPLSGLYEQGGDRWAVACITADGIRQAFQGPTAQLAWIAMLLVGLFVLLPSQMMVVDNVSRRWTDVIWSTNQTVRERMQPHQVKYIYYTILALFVFWSSISLYYFGGAHRGPKLMFVIAANLNNVAIGASSFHLLWINRRLLPAPLRPHWIMQLGLLGCGLFYLGLSALVFFSRVLPSIQQAW